MSKQRYIQDSFWTDPYVESLKTKEKLLFLYYLTNPLCNIAGIYEIRNSRVAYETQIIEEDIKIIKNKFVKDGKILIDNDWIIFINFAKHQSLNPNVKEGMQRIIKALPNRIKALKGFERLSHFTLLNLTYTEQSSGTPLKDKKMDIDYETGEQINEKPKSNKRDDVIKLAQLFDKLASEYSKRKIITPKSYFIVINAINKHGLKPKGIIKLYEEWFNNSKIKNEDKVNLSFALSASNINAFKVKN